MIIGIPVPETACRVLDNYKLSPGSQIIFEIGDHRENHADGSHRLWARFWLKFPPSEEDSDYLLLIEKVNIFIPTNFTGLQHGTELVSILSQRFLISIQDGSPGLVLFEIKFASPDPDSLHTLCSTSQHANVLVGFFVPGSGISALEAP